MDDNWFKPFSTRTGLAQGGATERTMASKVDTGGFRTVIQNNPDGSVTMMKTRGGAVEYTTTPAPKTKVVTACVGVMGPIQESIYASRQWYSSSDTDGLTTEQISALELELTMTSTDGIFKFLRQPLKKMVGTIGVDEQGEPSTTPVTIWFARSATVMPVVDPAVTGLKVTEKAARTYYDAVPAHGKDPHSFGLHYAIQRVKTLSLKFSSANACDAVMTFSKDVAGTPKTDFGNVNGASSETGLTNRTFYSGGGLKQVKLAVANKLNQWDFKDKGWFLDYLGGDNAYSLARRSKMLEITGTGIPVSGAPDLRPDCANLSKVQMFGQMWHGLATVDGLKTHERRLSDDVTIVPEQVRKIYDFTLPFGGDTYYVKSPAELPIPVTPDALLSIGAKFTEYALFSGQAKRYSCTSVFELGKTKFIHFDENNVAHVLGATLYGVSDGTISATVSIRVYDYGPIEAQVTGVLLGTVSATIDVRNEIVGGTWSSYVRPSQDTFIIDANSSGRKVLARIGYEGGLIKQVLEIDIPSSKTGLSMNLVWFSTYYKLVIQPGAQIIQRTESTAQTEERWAETKFDVNGNPSTYNNANFRETLRYTETRFWSKHSYHKSVFVTCGYLADNTRVVVGAESIRTMTDRVYIAEFPNSAYAGAPAPTEPVSPFPSATTEYVDLYLIRPVPYPAESYLISDTGNDTTVTVNCMGAINSVSYTREESSIGHTRDFNMRSNYVGSNNVSQLTIDLYSYSGGPSTITSNFIVTLTGKIIDDGSTTYATFNPVTEELSVGTTPRCFV